MVILPYLVETIVDIHTPRKWWNHLVRQDQCQYATRPVAFFSTVVIKAIPFAFLYAMLSSGSPMGFLILGFTVIIRLVTSGMILKWGLQDREGLRSLWLLPFRDIAALGSWVSTCIQRTTVWRLSKLNLTAHGLLVAQEAARGHQPSLQETHSASASG